MDILKPIRYFCLAATAMSLMIAIRPQGCIAKITAGL